MNAENRLHVVKLVTLGLGFGSLLYATRSVLRGWKQWRTARRSDLWLETLKGCMDDPLPSTHVVSNHAQWDRVFPLLSRYLL